VLFYDVVDRCHGLYENFINCVAFYIRGCEILVTELFKFVCDRWKVFALFNLLFFGCVLTVVVLAGFTFPPPLYNGWSPSVPEVFLGGGWPVMFLGIFLFNLCVSAFVVVTLPGIVLFPLSAVFLLYRAVLWGFLLNALPTWPFLAVLPTVVLEGEGYVFSAAVGTVVGASWIKPDWVFKDGELSRIDAFKRALKEGLRGYVFVAVLLLVAAVVETATIMFLSTLP